MERKDRVAHLNNSASSSGYSGFAKNHRKHEANEQLLRLSLPQATSYPIHTLPPVTTQYIQAHFPNNPDVARQRVAFNGRVNIPNSASTDHSPWSYPMPRRASLCPPPIPIFDETSFSQYRAAPFAHVHRPTHSSHLPPANFIIDHRSSSSGSYGTSKPAYSSYLPESNPAQCHLTLAAATGYPPSQPPNVQQQARPQSQSLQPQPQPQSQPQPQPQPQSQSQPQPNPPQPHAIGPNYGVYYGVPAQPGYIAMQTHIPTPSSPSSRRGGCSSRAGSGQGHQLIVVQGTRDWGLGIGDYGFGIRDLELKDASMDV
ncbi:hypothetical protein BDP27DRAFT_1373864 [Rhodocollybia butyracea]|uniref:Uncharacterized protein n=1 Tax=Rhodocollybia butyracea TaxID=206335 RepID=A0A9P5TWW8_9AGAR|nr:hypothetical protein BDP27DRAFT_1373864 [Rhodocollybia butyracea]